MDDEAIIGLYWARSEQAIARGILKSGADSEECINDTWLRAWESIPPQRPERLRAFLGRITRNLALDRLKRCKSQKRGGGHLELTLSELGDCLPSGDDPACRVGELALREALDRFLDGLNEDARIIFMRRYWYMLSVDEIARGMGVSRSKVKSSLMRSREKLRDMLEREGIML